MMNFVYSIAFVLGGLSAIVVENNPSIDDKLEFWNSYNDFLLEQSQLPHDPLKQLNEENINAFELCLEQKFTVEICINEFNGVVKE